MRFVHEEKMQPGCCAQEDGWRPLTGELGWLRGVCERRGVPLIRRDQEPVMAELLLRAAPARILEVGTALGYSACFMATVLPEAAVTTIEIYDRSFYDAKEAIARLGLSDRIRQCLGDAKDVLPQLAAEGAHYDLTFIDAAKSHYREYFEQALLMMDAGGLILCDNLMLGASLDDPGEGDRRHRTSAKKMEQFLNNLRCDTRVATTFYDCGDGLSVSRIL